MGRLQSRLVVGLVLGLALAGCTAKGIVPPRDAEGRYVVKMEPTLAFTPVEARIPVGGTVVWVNNGTVPHDVSGYAGDPPERDRPDFFSADEHGLTRRLGPGESFAHTFNARGTYTIWCHTHHEERMKGLIHVE